MIPAHSRFYICRNRNIRRLFDTYLTFVPRLSGTCSAFIRRFFRVYPVFVTNPLPYSQPHFPLRFLPRRLSLPEIPLSAPEVRRCSSAEIGRRP